MATEKRFSVKKSGSGLFYRDGDYEIDNTIQFIIETVEMKLNYLSDENKKLKIFLRAVNEELDFANRDCDTLEEEIKQLKSTIAKLIEENRKNNDLLLSDIRILEKALWCSGCANDYGRLKELRKEFMR